MEGRTSPKERWTIMAGTSMQNTVEGETKVTTHITQKELKSYVQAKARLEALHQRFLLSLKLGATVEPGEHRAVLNVGEEKRPNWRAALVERCGEATAKEVRAATVPTPYERLKVE